MLLADPTTAQQILQETTNRKRINSLCYCVFFVCLRSSPVEGEAHPQQQCTYSKYRRKKIFVKIITTQQKQTKTHRPVAFFSILLHYVYTTHTTPTQADDQPHDVAKGFCHCDSIFLQYTFLQWGVGSEANTTVTNGNQKKKQKKTLPLLLLPHLSANNTLTPHPHYFFLQLFRYSLPLLHTPELPCNVCALARLRLLRLCSLFCDFFLVF